jgi:hypothetical protein
VGPQPAYFTAAASVPVRSAPCGHAPWHSLNFLPDPHQPRSASSPTRGTRQRGGGAPPRRARRPAQGRSLPGCEGYCVGTRAGVRPGCRTARCGRFAGLGLGLDERQAVDGATRSPLAHRKTEDPELRGDWGLRLRRLVWCHLGPRSASTDDSTEPPPQPLMAPPAVSSPRHDDRGHVSPGRAPQPSPWVVGGGSPPMFGRRMPMRARQRGRSSFPPAYLARRS